MGNDSFSRLRPSVRTVRCTVSNAGLHECGMRSIAPVGECNRSHHARGRPGCRRLHHFPPTTALPLARSALGYVISIHITCRHALDRFCHRIRAPCLHASTRHRRSRFCAVEGQHGPCGFSGRVRASRCISTKQADKWLEIPVSMSTGRAITRIVAAGSR